ATAPEERDQLRASLIAARQLIAEHPGAVRELSLDLASALLNLNSDSDDAIVEGFAEKRMAALTELVCSDPGSVAPYLASQVFLPEYCTSQRLDALLALQTAALSLSRAKSPPVNAVASPPMPTVGRVTRRWGRPVHQQESSVSAFSQFAGEFFFGLARGFDTQARHLDLIGPDYPVLCRLLYTLGVVYFCAENSPGQARMLSALAELLPVVVRHPEAPVRRGALFCYACLGLATPHALTQELLTVASSSEAGNFFNSVDNEPDAECRQLAACAGSLLAGRLSEAWHSSELTLFSFGTMRQAMYTFTLTPRLQSIRSRRLLCYAGALATVVMLLLCIYNLTNGGLTYPLNEQYPGEPRYGIILDAGSTGSRVHVFEFRYQRGRKQPYVLVNELFQQVRPGLSAFARDPRRAAASLADLIDACKRRIPAHYWTSTPLALKATAGLRLLKPETSARILSEVRQLLAKSPFAMDRDSVAIMDGLDEGIFSWVTLNFLNGQLAKPEDSYGALDLGGGSTQVTFALPSANVASAVPAGFVKRLSLGGADARLYSHSYLGLGLMSARLAILQLSSQGKLPSSGAGGSKQFVTACLPSNYTGQWEHGGILYNLTGLATGRFYAFSYFYDRAADAGLIGAKEGGEVTLADIANAAEAACNRRSSDSKQPFHCMDLCYQAALLTKGYGFAPSSKFVMRKKIRNVELSWALGAVFDVFYNHANNSSGPATTN
uniref:Telomere_reg-2 domain-containing protein n=1 Tax=Macrostomum lignano TaxID=282301 RepID=A0A1I8GBY6_9PLAT